MIAGPGEVLKLQLVVTGVTITLASLARARFHHEAVVDHVSLIVPTCTTVACGKIATVISCFRPILFILFTLISRPTKWERLRYVRI
jgi:hypothetical protein